MCDITFFAFVHDEALWILLSYYFLTNMTPIEAFNEHQALR